MTSPRGERTRVVAGLLLVLAVAWSVPSSRIVEDTKNDLYVDPWGFLSRAFHLWDPQVTWGVLQNQGYGYLFPMGPVIGGLSEVVPVWMAQRLWWSLLLAGGYLAAYTLLRALGVGSVSSRVVAAAAYALAPRVLSTIGGLSSEAGPALLAPAVLLPVVLASHGRMTARRAAALSGLAVLACGGVNATATLLAVVPTGLFLLTRRRWWREALTWWWAGAAVCACAWWMGPLVVLGRWSPPFLGWIERSRDVVRDLDAVDVISGSTHWLQLVVTGAGAWWPAGHELATIPLLVVATVVAGAAGLAGLGLPGMPERRWLLVCAGTGALLLLVAHPGPVGSPVAGLAQQALDGPLVAFRNIHKADPLVRLPLAVGLAHAVHVASAAAARHRVGRTVLRTVVVALTLAVASPGLSGAVAPPGAFPGMPRQWVEAGAWLSERADQGRALVVPASSFGEYDWGRTIDEPIRPLSSVDHAVRDAVPLTPAGTIRFLDDVERRLQTGRDLGATVDVLRRLGVRWLVLRNDLDPGASGQPAPAWARSAVRSTPRARFAEGFGPTRLDAAGERVFPVEVYDIGAPAPLAVIQPVADVVGVTGGAEDLAAVFEAGARGLVVLEGDRPASLQPGRRVVTDGNRLRGRSFGATRGRDATSTLTAEEAQGTRDYRPWDDLRRSSTVLWRGISSVRASSSVATEYGLGGLRPADRPAAALDGDPTTAWRTFGDDRPTLDVVLEGPRDVPSVRVDGVRRPEGVRGGTSPPTRVRLTTDGGAVEADLPFAGADIPLPAGTTRRLRVEVLDTADDVPGRVLTGLSTVALSGVAPLEVVSTPAPSGTTTPADSVVLGSGLPAVGGCPHPEDVAVCLGDVLPGEGGAVMARRVDGVAPGAFSAVGTLVPGNGAISGQAVDGVRVTASSSRTDAPAGAPEGVVDADRATAWSPAPGDRDVSLTLRLDRPVDVEGLRLDARRGWAARYRPVVGVRLDGQEQVVRASADGHLAVRGDGVRVVSLSFLAGAARGTATAALELAELEVLGAELPRPPRAVSLPCGSGPTLTVDGAQVPTAASGPRSALWGVGRVEWRACGPVELGAGPHEVELRAVDGWQPDTAALTPRRASAQPAGPAPAEVARRSPTLLAGVLPAGPERLLAIDTNANAGWKATVAGERLAPVVVDGFRQGYVVPAGAAGALEVRFAPDGAYRAALGGGALLALLLPLALVGWRLGSARRIHPAQRPLRRGLAVGVVAVGALLLTGPWGLLAALAGLALGQLASVRGRAPWLGAALVVVAGVVVAAAGPGVGTPGWADVAATLLVTGGAGLVASALVGRRGASPAVPRSGGWPTRAPATAAAPARAAARARP
jgi:arabinofuranan 3-O-arabinosyltransferase